MAFLVLSFFPIISEWPNATFFDLHFFNTLLKRLSNFSSAMVYNELEGRKYRWPFFAIFQNAVLVLFCAMLAFQSRFLFRKFFAGPCRFLRTVIEVVYHTAPSSLSRSAFLSCLFEDDLMSMSFDYRTMVPTFKIGSEDGTYTSTIKSPFCTSLIRH